MARPYLCVLLLLITLLGFNHCEEDFDLDDRPTRPPETEDCMDTIHFCKWYQDKGYCTDRRFIDYMTRNCPKTCGICTPDVLMSADGTTDGCLDVIPYCDYYVKKGYCTNPEYDSYMKRDCKLSCNFCKSGGTTKAPHITRQPETDCQDKITYCDYYKKKGYCTQRYINYMKKNCPKSCKFCNPGDKTTTTTEPKTQSPSTGICGKPAVGQGRVIAGRDARKGAWPWQILMLYMRHPMCGGALISANWVVTAAHCVYRRNATQIKVRVGEHVVSSTRDGKHTDIQVEKIISHHNYSKSRHDNDIALLKLSRPATFNKFVKPVCLPRYKEDVPVGTECYITGWGKITHPGRMYSKLQEGKMPVVNNTECTKLNTKNLGIQITKNMVCAGYGGTKRVSGCHGDSGGPFVCKTGPQRSWVLHGAVSWGSNRCDAKHGYTVFARISEYRQWIEQVITQE